MEIKFEKAISSSGLECATCVCAESCRGVEMSFYNHTRIIVAILKSAFNVVACVFVKWDKNSFKLAGPLSLPVTLLNGMLGNNRSLQCFLLHRPKACWVAYALNRSLHCLSFKVPNCMLGTARPSPLATILSCTVPNCMLGIAHPPSVCPTSLPTIAAVTLRHHIYSWFSLANIYLLLVEFILS